MMREWSDPPARWGYFSRLGHDMHLECKKHLPPGYQSKFYQMLPLPPKVKLQLHQILRPPRKMTLQHPQMLRLPRKVTRQPHVNFAILFSSILYSSMLLSFIPSSSILCSSFLYDVVSISEFCQLNFLYKLNLYITVLFFFCQGCIDLVLIFHTYCNSLHPLIKKRWSCGTAGTEPAWFITTYPAELWRHTSTSKSMKSVPRIPTTSNWPSPSKSVTLKGWLQFKGHELFGPARSSDTLWLAWCSKKRGWTGWSSSTNSGDSLKIAKSKSPSKSQSAKYGW